MGRLEGARGRRQKKPVLRLRLEVTLQARNTQSLAVIDPEIFV
jgi:hypothetical protein